MLACEPMAVRTFAQVALVCITILDSVLLAPVYTVQVALPVTW